MIGGYDEAAYKRMVQDALDRIAPSILQLQREINEQQARFWSTWLPVDRHRAALQTSFERRSR